MNQNRYDPICLKRAFLPLIILISAFSMSAQTPTPTPEPHAAVKRWFDIETLSLAARYRYMDTRDGTVVSNALQFQVNARARFRFDRRGRFSIVAAAATGRNLVSGWNYTGAGTSDLQTNIAVKQLYFEARPVNELEVQVGGIAPNNGENSEITGYDNDAYLMGQRIRIRAPKKIFFDEISVTNGHLGDALVPSVFRRFKRLDESNYRQLLVRKRVNARVAFSADYTYAAGTDTLRQAVRLGVAESRIVDKVLFENYQRLDPEPGYGFAVSGEKRLHPRVLLTGGFGRIPHQTFNADRFPRGKRFYLTAAVRLTPELSLSPAIIRSVGALPTDLSPRTRLDVALIFDIRAALRRAGVF